MLGFYRIVERSIKINDYHLIIGAVTIVIIIKTYAKENPMKFIKIFKYIIEF